MVAGTDIRACVWDRIHWCQINRILTTICKKTEHKQNFHLAAHCSTKVDLLTHFICLSTAWLPTLSLRLAFCCSSQDNSLISVRRNYCNLCKLNCLPNNVGLATWKLLKILKKYIFVLLFECTLTTLLNIT